MTKTKSQLRAEAVERLRSSEYHTALDDICAMLGWGHEPHFEGATDALIDLLTDDCGPCYSCAKLAELVAENSQLRVKVDAQRDSNGTCPDAIGQPSDAQSKNGASLRELYGIWSDDSGHSEGVSRNEQKSVRDGGETSDIDSRDNGWYLRYDGYMTSKSNYLRISGFKAARALDNRQNLVFVKFMGGTEADCRVYAPKLDVCENLHDSSMETQKPRSREADSGNVSDSDGENLHVEQDTREKLEADVRQLAFDHVPSLDSSDEYALRAKVMKLLDRQVSITEHTAGIAAKEASKVLRETIADLREEVAERDDVIAVLKAENAELTVERDEWKVKAGKAERAMNKAAGNWCKADDKAGYWKSEVEECLKAARIESVSEGVMAYPRMEGYTAPSLLVQSQFDYLDQLCVDLNHKLDELANGNDGETNVITSGSPLVDELPKGDVPSEFAEILMALAADCSCMGDGIVRHFDPKDVQGDVDALMRVVERDYVRRSAYNSLKELTTNSDKWLMSKLEEARAERDELRSKLDELAERKCPGYEPESHHCRYHHQDFELNHQTVSRLKRENAELSRDLGECMAENEKLKAGLLPQSDDEGLA